MPKNISQILHEAQQKIDLFDAQVLLAHIIQKPREYVISHPEHILSFFAVWKFKKCVQRRKQGIPLAYITGEKEFFGLNFLVNKHTLVPRPDTEVLVEAVIAEIHTQLQSSQEKNIEKINLCLIDVGTGSGCIPVSVVHNFQKNACEKMQTFAIDISSQALHIAKINAKKYSAAITFLHGNLLEPIIKKIESEFKNKNVQSNEKYISSASLIITANLPYLTQQQFEEEPSIQHEPHSALVANENGLELYKQLFDQIKTLEEKNKINKHWILFIEIDPSQTEELQTYIPTIFPNKATTLIQDYNHQNRVLKLQ